MNEEMPRATNWIEHSDERDRIDYIFSKGGKIKPKDAWLVGTPLTSVKGDIVDESEAFCDKCSYSVGHVWPSDHRGVMTLFDIEGE
mmetsp:Transcript_12641/g.21070  ORF Transcript_12641/g.21070 Transcript_12641/m.21070 type:complete len:86 (+) Transcript_12641:976-1233(+)